ncbi:MAG: hypothetical protein Q9M14_06345 [Mariprofundaceae bacterium]|nr:hypothetical protein [Mariprofundaceae bacterium]
MTPHFFSRQKILFSDNYGWGEHIRSRINALRYAPSFENFQQVDLDGFEILIPMAINDIAFMHDKHLELQGKKCFIPPLQTLNLCNDKMQFNRFMVEHGYGRMIPTVSNQLSFPYILKKRIDENGIQSRIIESTKDEQFFKEFISSDEYFRQAYVAGQDEFTTHILMVDGRIVFHKTLVFSFEQALFIKGVGYRPSKKPNPCACADIDLFAEILNALNYEGLCCFNYKLVAGKMQIFELNPRYGCSLTYFLPAMMKVYCEILGT